MARLKLERARAWIPRPANATCYMLTLSFEQTQHEYVPYTLESGFSFVYDTCSASGTRRSARFGTYEVSADTVGSGRETSARIPTAP